MAAAAMGRQRRRARRRAWSVWARPGSEVAALLATALVGVIAALGWLADAGAGASPWWHLVLFVGGVLVLGIGAATLLRAWLRVRRWLARRGTALPAGAALSVAGIALWLASGPVFRAQVASVRTLVGGRAETERLTLTHQVYAAYRRADLAALTRVLERARLRADRARGGRRLRCRRGGADGCGRRGVRVLPPRQRGRRARALPDHGAAGGRGDRGPAAARRRGPRPPQPAPQRLPR